MFNIARLLSPRREAGRGLFESSGGRCGARFGDTIRNLSAALAE
jgi:hypothetical protein